MNYTILSLFNITTKVENKIIYFIFDSTGVEYTELRMLQFINDYKIILDDLEDTRIKNVCFVFKLNNMKFPSNFVLVQEFANLFYPKMDLIIKKVNYSVILSNNKIFYMFFTLLKQFYRPIKPLYLCNTNDELNDIIENPENRIKYKNIIDELKE